MVDEEAARREGPGIIGLLTQVSKAINRRSTEELLGMRLKEFLILSYLRDHHPNATQQELGEAMLLDANTVVLLLNELESRGYSIRRRDAEDRRRHVVEITRAGRDAVGRAEKARDAIEGDMLAELSAEERRTLRGILLRLLDSQRAPAAPSRS